MSIIDAIIQGIIQGLSEFLPISSSGHLNITQHILGVTENNLFFSVMLHVGTLISVCVVYHKLLLRLIKAFFAMVGDIFKGKFKWREMDEDRNLVVMLIIGLIPLFILFLPAPFAGGMQIKDLADLWSSNSGYFIVVGFSLLLTSILLTVGRMMGKYTAKKYQEKGISNQDGVGRKRYNVIDAISVGVVQVFAAVLPGLSRSGSTLSVGQLRGINKQKALDYTFILGTPAIIAAAILEVGDAIETNAVAQVNPFVVIVGVIVSAVCGLFAIKLFKWMLAKDRLIIFIIYTAVVGLAVIIISIIEINAGVNIFTQQPLTFG